MLAKSVRRSELLEAASLEVGLAGGRAHAWCNGFAWQEGWSQTARDEATAQAWSSLPVRALRAVRLALFSLPASFFAGSFRAHMPRRLLAECTWSSSQPGSQGGHAVLYWAPCLEWCHVLTSPGAHQ